MIQNITKLILLGFLIAFFTGCEGWTTGEHPQVTAIKKIAEYADNNSSKSPDEALYKDAGIEIDSDDVNKTNNYIRTLKSSDVDTREELQDIVDNLETLTAAPNEKPKAVIDVHSKTVKEGELVLLDAFKSTDSDGIIEEYEWKEDDKLLHNGRTYDANLSVKRHAIALTVTDDDGDSDTAYISILVTKGAPTKVDDSEVLEAVIVANGNSLDGSKSTGENLTYQWNDNGENKSSVSKYTITTKGKHTVKLTVIDKNNKEDSTTIVLNYDDNRTDNTDNNDTDTDNTDNNNTDDNNSK